MNAIRVAAAGLTALWLWSPSGEAGGLADPAAASAAPLRPPPAMGEALDWGRLTASLDRAVQGGFREQPFENGDMALVWVDGTGALRTGRLVPCRHGQAICSGGERGPAGRLDRTPDWYVVSGLPQGRFWLHPGGEGFLEVSGTFLPLAWNARHNGTGPGTGPSLESGAPHR